MKSIKNKKSSATKKNLLLVAIAAIILSLSALTYVYGMNGDLFGWKSAGPGAEAQNNSSNRDQSSSTNSKDNLQKDTASSDDTGKPDAPGTTDSTGSGAAPVQPKELRASITAANQNGDMLQIRTLIEDVVANGTCVLQLTKTGSASVTKTVSIQALASSSTCKGFDVPTGSFTKGQWVISIDIAASDKRAHLTQAVAIK